MSFTWADYLSVARGLLKYEDEASIRAAASRAYYAAFGEAREVAEKETGRSVQGDQESSHVAVVNYYERSPLNVRKAFGANLNRLKKIRVFADYPRDQPFDSKIGAQAIVDATQLLEDLKRIQLENE